ncbi:MAG: TonB-dependent receptor [Myxococcota bacterium]
MRSLAPFRTVAGAALVAALLVGAPGVFEASAQDRTPPTLVEEAPPAQAPGELPAEVTCRLTIDSGGTVTDAECGDIAFSPEAEEEAAPTDETLEAYREGARAYVMTLAFEPARVDGRPVLAQINFRVQFQLPADPPTEANPPTEAEGPANPPEESHESPVASTEPPEAEAGLESAGPVMEDEGEGFGAQAEVQATVSDEAPPVSTSDFDVEVGELRRVPRSQAQQMLTLVPGVLLTQHATEGHALAMFLRGFDAAEGEDLEVLVDGMPINEVSNAHGHGYVDTLFVIPELVASLRVVQGPFDPSQGDFATAGTAEYRLGLPERGFHLSVGYGRFNEVRTTALWGPSGASEGTFAGIRYGEGDGFGPNRSFRNASAMARYEGGADDGTLRYSLLGFASTGSWRSAGVLREDDFERRDNPNCPSDEDSQFFCFYDPNQGGSTLRGGLNGRVRFAGQNELGEVLAFGQARSLRIQENFTGFLTDPRTDGLPQRGDNFDQQYDVATLGARARYLVAQRLLGFDQRLEVGAHLRFDDADTITDRRRAELSVPYRSDFDRRVRETLVGAYVRADARLTRWLSLTAGGRLDFFGFNVTDRNFPTEDAVGPRLERTSTSASGLALSPRGTARVEVVEGLSFVLSGGLGARSSDAAALSEGLLAPFALVFALEGGLDFHYQSERPEVGAPRREWNGRGFRLEARGSAFATRVSQDLVFDPEAGRNSLLGPSVRSGLLAQVRARQHRWLDVLASITYTRAHLQPTNANDLDLFAGPRLPFIPSVVARVDAAIVHDVDLLGETFELSGALGVQFVGERPLPFERVAEPFTLVDLAVGARWRFFELSFAVQNLFDTRYQNAVFNYASNFDDPELPPSMLAAQHFAAGPPLTFLATLAVHFDPGDASEEPDGSSPEAVFPEAALSGQGSTEGASTETVETTLEADSPGAATTRTGTSEESPPEPSAASGDPEASEEESSPQPTEVDADSTDASGPEPSPESEVSGEAAGEEPQ